jgi:hypothetical protein
MITKVKKSSGFEFTIVSTDDKKIQRILNEVREGQKVEVGDSITITIEPQIRKEKKGELVARVLEQGYFDH